jgi:hypothetical protein
MKMLQQVHHFILHPHVLKSPATDATHATIAAEAIEAAKGGHVVSLAMPTGDPVLVAPHADLGEVTDQVAAAMGGAVDEPVSPPFDTDPTPPKGRGKKGSTDEG